MKRLKQEKRDGIYFHSKFGTTRLVSFRFPVDLHNEIKAVQEYWDNATFTETLFELINEGFASFARDDEHLKKIVLSIPPTPAPEPSHRQHLAEIRHKDDTVKDKEMYFEEMRRDYQFCDRDDFIKQGIPADIVDEFFRKLEQ